MWKTFIQNVIACTLAFAAVHTISQVIGEAIVYSDHVTDQHMTECVANGYTWGECYNSIAGHSGNFTQ